MKVITNRSKSLVKTFQTLKEVFKFCTKNLKSIILVTKSGSDFDIEFDLLLQLN